MRAWLLSFAMMLGAVGCDSALGRSCNAQSGCPEGLVCGVPPQGTGENPLGVCDYPPRGENEPCSQAAECATSLTCSTHFTDNTRYGRCVPRRSVGEACYQDRDCAVGKCKDGACAG